MYEIKLKARAKINITLDVLNRREDGYHNVKMIMQTLNLYDDIAISKYNEGQIKINANLRWLPINEKNLAYKAAKLIIDNYNVSSGVYIDIHKRIPVAAGLAGGSSDAAAVLVGMNKLFNLNIPIDELMKLGKKIGADVPYCIIRGTVLAEGIGEVLTPLPPFPKCYVLLAKPGIRVSTPWVYQNLDLNNVVKHPDTDLVINYIKQNNIKEISNNILNVLEMVTTKKYPVIDQIKNIMIDNGAMGAMMSGSGPTVFGIYKDKQKAKDTLRELRNGGIAKYVYLTSIFNNFEEA